MTLTSSCKRCGMVVVP